MLQISGNKQIAIVCLFLAAATSVAFLQVNECDFTSFDDGQYITANPYIENGITVGAIKWAFTSGYACNWHPLTWLSHMLDIQLFGLNPHRHHLVNLLFHIANTLLLFLVLYRMTKMPWKCAFVAALFALHPLHVESVAWVAERKDVLSTFFWMLTMAAYVHYAEKPRLTRYLVVLVFYILGLMAKPMLVTLPFVLLLLDYWPLNRTSGVNLLIREKIPLFLLAAVSCIVTYTAQQHGGAMTSFGGVPPGDRIANAFVSCVVYILKTIWPVNLAVFYPYREGLPLWQILGAVLLLFAVTLTVILESRRFPYLATGWLWFAGALVPVLGIVQVGRQAMADRYSYVPLIGLFIIVAWGAPEILAKWRRRREVLFTLSAIILFCLSIMTWTQVGHWKDSLRLYDHALKAAGHSDVIHYNRAEVYQYLGDVDRALADYSGAIEANPGHARAYGNRGNIYAQLGNYRQAISDYDNAIKADPDIAGDYKRAIEDYSRAIEVNPEYTNAYNNRGLANWKLGNSKQAMEDYGRAIELDPGYVKSYLNRSVAYHQLGLEREAIEDLKTAARHNSQKAKDFLKNEGIGW